MAEPAPALNLDQSPAAALQLVEGAVMDQPTFHRLYEAANPSLKAELVEGVVHIKSPASLSHATPHGLLIWWLGEYAMMSPGVEPLVGPTVILGSHSEPEPDGCLRILETYGGQCRVENGYLNGPVELVVEVEVSTRSFDLGPKRRDYQRAGVQEYLAVAPSAGRVHWFAAAGGAYTELQPAANGIRRSRVFPGLWLDPPALLKLDSLRVREVLHLGLASAEHQRFIESIAASGGKA